MKVVRLKDILRERCWLFFGRFFFSGKGNEKMVSVNNRSAHFIVREFSDVPVNLFIFFQKNYIDLIFEIDNYGYYFIFDSMRR